MNINLTSPSGATKGIGRAIALNLASRGCSILGTYSSPGSAHNFEVLSHTIGDLYRAPNTPQHLQGADSTKIKGVVADITSLPSVGQILLTLEKEFDNKLDILVLNAGFNARPKLGSASEADITNSLTANLHWPIVLMENIVRQSLFNPSSRVVVLSSDRVRDPSPGSSIFNATKTGLESLARSWAIELPLSFPGTTVNAVSVGLTDTPGLRAFPAAAVEALKAQRLKKVKVVEGGRMGFAEDVADVVGWLVSEKARWVSGSVVAANGGAEWVGGSS
ncbi:NAD(P)-binding protein [Lentithecium fluviatile CBS 122367]|uniref:NAD(P)-binding protein n=1 Tax=Lentithecium fluviatile CBS 122367 TaxID=1168545 RepID=A0A6G1IW01_9PLEO|nr:NAD(P)-binding protein [Lentithecium fluviatile CBS 122367]